ncbi:ABC transporter substrate-binding protein [Dokdonia pacifica]|uniref:Iron complex transport system substrate-binding protein n=1 Tax=Dokdonia pacifica TaxID=1627892 RepID=A0A238ZLH5_9FLAO|nr:ABC transporter substrate-binding protein [Dokdonia pacifica]GGG07328.1 ABC transporter substrate-binding protein [Dokdonia pacifica]SNR84306.1 iron complex transport system substrate-binding protein [Dokdonia pacifica]
MRFLFICLSLVFISTSCKEIQKKSDTPSQVSIQEKRIEQIDYAKGFSITHYTNYKEIKVTSAWPDSEETFTYILTQDISTYDQQDENTVIVELPIKKMVAMSTTNIPSLEYLGVDDLLVGFPNPDYISSEKTRARIDKGEIKNLNSSIDINMELLLELAPELVIGFSVNGNNETLDKIAQFGIPVILDGAWTEQHPLGRAEWIKFIATFFDKETEAHEIFKQVERDYLAAKQIASHVIEKPIVFSGSPFKDTWNIPGGKSFVAKYLEDANTDYLWKDTPNTGSLQLNFESVLVKAQHAPLWIGAGSFKNKAQMHANSKNYALFDAYNNNNVYTYTNKIGENGGLLYFELGPLRPDIILKDIIAIAHPQLIPDYSPFFFKRLE